MKTITIIGNLGKDAEVRTSSNGSEYCYFSVAVNTRTNGEKSVMWFTVFLNDIGRKDLLTKGKKVCVVGDYSDDIFQGGITRNIRATYLELVGGEMKEENAGSITSKQVNNYKKKNDDLFSNGEDELPF